MKLEIDQSVELKIKAKDYYSSGGTEIEVNRGEAYSFTANPKRIWWDFYWPTKAKGFNNILIKSDAIRVKGGKCFELIGSIGKSDEITFVIGMQREKYDIPTAGVLYFFANDHPKHYWNNFGSMKLTVKRLS